MQRLQQRACAVCVFISVRASRNEISSVCLYLRISLVEVEKTASKSAMENITSRPFFLPATTSHVSVTAVIIVSCTVFVLIAILLFLCCTCSSNYNRRSNDDDARTFESDLASEDEGFGAKQRDGYENEVFEMRVFNQQESGSEGNEDL